MRRERILPTVEVGSVVARQQRPVRLPSMSEAVIVAAARSPIGRAGKGSLRDIRPDDLLETIARAALAQLPALDPSEIDDVYIGCARPQGEQGTNLARRLAVQ